MKQIDNEVPFKLIIVGVLLVLSLGVASWWSFFQKGPTIKKVASVALRDSRGPASVGSLAESEPVVKFDCQSNQTVVQVQTNHVRLIGSGCATHAIDSVSIRNLKNGFTASTVDLGSGSFTTDFIELGEGENEIELQQKSQNGQKVVHTLKVNRTPASAIQ